MTDVPSHIYIYNMCENCSVRADTEAALSCSVDKTLPVQQVRARGVICVISIVQWFPHQKKSRYIRDVLFHAKTYPVRVLNVT